MADDDFWMQVEQEEMQQWYQDMKAEFKRIFEENEDDDERDIQST